MKKPKLPKKGGVKRIAAKLNELRNRPIPESIREAFEKKETVSSKKFVEGLNDKVLKDRAILQSMAHYYGCDDFLELLVQVLYNASEDSALVSEEISKNYLAKAQLIDELLLIEDEEDEEDE